jgi:hypothetical protein
MATIVSARPGSDTRGVIASRPSRTKGIVIAAVGVVYLVAGTLANWWTVPFYQTRGGINDLILDWYMGENLSGLVVYLAWELSGPVGAIVAVLGALLAFETPTRRYWLILAGGVLVIAWLAGAQLLDTPLVPELFGVCGVLIVVFFLGMLWDWSRGRAARSAAEQAGGDLQMLGLVFFLIAAWELCGLFGAPVFLLLPDIGIALTKANTYAATVMVFLTLGWALTFIGGRMAMRRRGTRPAAASSTGHA